MANNTYVALASTTITGSSTVTFTFSSIPQTYTDLVLVCDAKASAGAAMGIRPNGSTGTYSATYINGNGTSATSQRRTNATNSFMYIGYNYNMSSTVGGLAIGYFMDYANTTTNKTVLSRYNIASLGVEAGVSLWQNTAAITSLEVWCNSPYYWVAGTTFTLYGIREEGLSPTTKATGGAVYSDSTYYYHVFGASGTFTPTQSITADILVVAGGGGGAHGGGGAGGLLAFTGQALTATAYTCTVGTGGAGGSGTTKGTNGNDSQFGALTLVKGGGGGGVGGTYTPTRTAGLSGGSGGGGAPNGAEAGTGGSPTSGQGNSGGNAGTGALSYPGGGGGGAGAAGSNGVNAVGGGAGGVGSSSYSSWGVATGVGQNVSGTYYLAGGGAGGSDYASVAGGFGGGGAGAVNTATRGLANTGGGAGGSANSAGVAGGSGVIIVRYAK